ncbi:hypothetical protein N9E91_03175 [Alphaproteobacteria bacterium]|nr:hypothetical protein [Alphaproteobacteria bacterium]
MQKILITGSSSLIATKLIKYLEKKEIEITCTLRSSEILPELIGLKQIKQDLEEEFGDDFVSHVKASNILIHMAWIRPYQARQSSSRNLAIMKRLMALNSNLKIVFVSSYKANENSKSYYLKAKYVCEEALSNGKHLIWKIPYVMSEPSIGPDIMLKKWLGKLPVSPKLIPSPELVSIDFDEMVEMMSENLNAIGRVNIGSQFAGGLNQLLFSPKKPAIYLPHRLLLLFFCFCASLFPSVGVFDKVITVLDYPPK